VKAIRGASDFETAFDVSRETLSRLTRLTAAVTRWNSAINLVAPGTLENIWARHVADSAQLWPLRPPDAPSWIDLGSGGGFPGLVIAILSADAPRPLALTLVESDRRKAAFLSTVIRDLELPAQVLPQRVEALQVPAQEVVSARAFAPLDRLLGDVVRLRHAGGRALLPKGRTYNNELDAARRLWNFDYKLHPSMTDPDAAIIEIGAIHGKR
jgi:16S rRNA (guanine527-N7)-methyltransferase